MPIILYFLLFIDIIFLETKKLQNGPWKYRIIMLNLKNFAKKCFQIWKTITKLTLILLFLYGILFIIQQKFYRNHPRRILPKKGVAVKFIHQFTINEEFMGDKLREDLSHVLEYDRGYVWCFFWFFNKSNNKIPFIDKFSSKMDLCECFIFRLS